MSVNKFGQSSAQSKRLCMTRIPGVVLEYTTDGNVNIENLRLCNLKPPINDNDAVTKKYLNEKYDVLFREIKNLVADRNSLSSYVTKSFKEVAQHIKNLDATVPDVKSELDALKNNQKIDRKNVDSKINAVISAIPQMIDQKINISSGVLNKHLLEIVKELSDLKESTANALKQISALSNVTKDLNHQVIKHTDLEKRIKLLEDDVYDIQYSTQDLIVTTSKISDKLDKLSQ